MPPRDTFRAAAQARRPHYARVLRLRTRNERLDQIAMRPEGVELAAERTAHRRHDHGHVLRGPADLVPHDASAPVVDEPFPCRHDVRLAVAIIVA